MPITVTCPTCGKSAIASVEAAGRRVNCLGCGREFDVPGPSPGVAVLATGPGRAAAPRRRGSEELVEEHLRIIREECARTRMAATGVLALSAIACVLLALVLILGVPIRP